MPLIDFRVGTEHPSLFPDLFDECYEQGPPVQQWSLDDDYNHESQNYFGLECNNTEDEAEKVNDEDEADNVAEDGRPSPTLQELLECHFFYLMTSLGMV